MNLVVFLGLYFAANFLEYSDANCGCQSKYKKVGCYKDKRYARVLPEMISNERNVIQWHNWDNFMPKMVCRCAEIAIKKGYKYFGLQFWGECWSGATAFPGGRSYDEYGEGKQCFGNGYKSCSDMDEHCVGSTNHNFVYEIASYECSVHFEKTGCYWDNASERDQNELLITRRDPSSPASDGNKIDWKNWDIYVPEFACKCAEAAASMNYSVFGLQFYGECWSNLHFETAYHELGTSTDCVNTCWGSCNTFNEFCMGGPNCNAVYRITHPDCSQKYEPIGCYASGDDVMPEVMINDISPERPQFSGKMMSFGDDWEEKISDLICRCAQKVAEKNYATFGITADGVCVSGPNAQENYNENGESSFCRKKAEPLQSCSDDRKCSGDEDSLYVFSLVEDVEQIG